MTLLTADFRDGAVREWHVTAGGVESRVNPDYTPTVYVGGDRTDLGRLQNRLAGDPKLAATGVERWYPDLHAHERADVLRVDLGRMADVRPFAREVRGHHESAAFRPATFRLANVDLAPGFRYCVETDTPPIPAQERDLRTLRLLLPEKALADGDVSALRIGGDPVAGDDATTLRAVHACLDAVDPDVLVLSSADLVPLLADAADRTGVDCHLGRRPGYTKLAGESTFESYGTVGHSPARYRVPGRAIVDRSNSFLWAEAGLPGLRYLVRQSWRPLQETAWGSIGTILTAMQTREALDREVLVPWNKWDAEAFKTVETLHAADRGGFTFAPDVGVHEDVVEVDFASLYPNVMCEFNVSPETVGCDCHDGDDVPNLDYSICDRDGFVPNVLRPLVNDREALKEVIAATDDPDEAARLEGTSAAIKWILVSCFGYQGYRNAKFGRIECHEAINAYAREILLDAKDALERHGWRVVHGIVDSLWVTPHEATPTQIQEVCAEVTEDVGIRLEHENDFEWVAFVPKRDGDAGALTKYFGKLTDANDFKVRGIELRQRSTPEFVAEVQRDLLAAVDDTRDPAAACDHLARHLSRLRSGGVDPDALVCRRRVSKPADAYRHATLSVAALRRAERLGLPRAPGQDVRYVVTDADGRGDDRVRLAFEDPAAYDPDHYADVTIRAAASILAPFGLDREGVERALRDTRDATLSSFR